MPPVPPVPEPAAVLPVVPGPADVPGPQPHAEAVLSSLLAAHVPVSLLLDLADPHGPCSSELLWREQGSADWLER